MDTTSAKDWTMIAIILFALFMFGIAYAFVVYSWLRERTEGYTALMVVAGVLITLAGAAVINWQAAVWVLACFVASGLPMILGDMITTTSRRERRMRGMRLYAIAKAEGIIGKGMADDGEA